MLAPVTVAPIFKTHPPATAFPLTRVVRPESRMLPLLRTSPSLPAVRIVYGNFLESKLSVWLPPESVTPSLPQSAQRKSD